MYLIQNFTTDAKQKKTVQLTDGSSFRMRLYYCDNMQGWYILELTYKTFTVNGIRLVNAQNLLRQFRNKIPFGLFVTTTNHRDNLLIGDLNSGATSIYVLTSAEVAAYEAYVASH